MIILGIAAAFGTHLIAYGIVEDIAKEKRSYAVYNTISVVGAGSFDRNTYERITALPDVKNAFCFFAPGDADYVIVGWYGKSPGNWFPLGEGSFLGGIPGKKEAYTSSNIAQYDPNSKKTCLLYTSYTNQKYFESDAREIRHGSMIRPCKLFVVHLSLIHI